MSDSAINNLILDIGDYSIKAGMSNEKNPRFIIPSAFPAGETDFPIDQKIPNDKKVEFCIKTEKAQVSGNLNVQIHKNIGENRIA